MAGWLADMGRSGDDRRARWNKDKLVVERTLAAGDRIVDRYSVEDDAM